MCTAKADDTRNLTTKTEGDKSTGKAFTIQQPEILSQAMEYPHIFLKISLEEREQQSKTKTNGLKNENSSRGQAAATELLLGKISTLTPVCQKSPKF